MERKIVATALGAFGFGVLVGWAVTSDIREKKLLDERKQYEGMIHYKTEHIWALQDRVEKLEINKFGVVTSSGGIDTTWTVPSNQIIDVIAKGTVIPKEEVDQDQLDAINNIVDDEEVEIPEGETVEETRSNLQRIIDTYVADPDAQTVMVELIGNDIEDNSPPFVISQATYAWDEEGENYDKISLSYLPRDRVLLDDEEDPIEDVNRTVGWRNLTQFGGESGDPDVVFVRNRSLKTDFEVIKDDDAQLPLHVKYGMEKEEFRANKAAGLIRLRQEDDDH